MMEVKPENIPFTMPGAQWMDGIPYPKDYPVDNLRKLPSIPVYDDDVYVVGYPKSGSIWTMTAVEAILRADNLEDMIQNGVTSSRWPLEKIISYHDFLTCRRPRIIHSHMLYHQLPRGIAQQRGKVIFMMRNPRDVAVSYYHFVRNNEVFGYFPGTWDTFFEAYMDGQVAWGSWYNFNTDWFKYRNQPNILSIKYENFLKDPSKTVCDVAEFVGKTLTSEQLNKITDAISANSMRSNAALNIDNDKGDFIRRAKVGDWVNYFNKEQEERIEEMYQKFKAETGIELVFK